MGWDRWDRWCGTGATHGMGQVRQVVWDRCDGIGGMGQVAEVVWDRLCGTGGTHGMGNTYAADMMTQMRRPMAISIKVL